jgi:hypothetical protein
MRVRDDLERCARQIIVWSAGIHSKPIRIPL